MEAITQRSKKNLSKNTFWNS